MKNKFILKSNFNPEGDQPAAIAKLSDGLKNNEKYQTLLGVTGSGKTFTMAKLIEAHGRPTLIISHNKTLAAQLYDEFKEFFPDNAVHYFVSYYDYYQPEAYIPRTDTYIEKTSDINEEIDRLRNAATSALLSRDDVIIIASVSCIYGLGNPEEYENLSVKIVVGEERNRDRLLRLLADVQYNRNDKSLERGSYRVRGDIVDIFPSYEEEAYRVEFLGNKVEKIRKINPLTGEILDAYNELTVFPAKHFVTTKERIKEASIKVQAELEQRVAEFEKAGKLLEAQRISQRTNYDLEMLNELGYCSGIENYSRYLTNREPGSEPATLMDYFPEDLLILIDESHMTIPQIRGMYNGDRARKQNLVDFGFRLPSALDNRPLRFEEFERHIKNIVFVSATPAEFELSHSTKGLIKSSVDYYLAREENKEFNNIAEQVIRPTGLLDPIVEVRPIDGQIDDLIKEIRETVQKKQRVIITTLTKRMSEELANYLAEVGIRVKYIHSDIHTLERPEILRDLRLGVYDVIVGINLLREGIDLPEVSLVAILDADKEGFLRSDQSLIQTIGRAARHKDGRVIMYADSITGSMKRAIEETERRREIQEAYNKAHDITPQTIEKAIRESLADHKKEDEKPEFDIKSVPAEELGKLVKELERKMDFAAKNLEFERAADLRDQIIQIQAELEKSKFNKKVKKQ
jgi:excinuclease ABC subunit B